MGGGILAFGAVTGPTPPVVTAAPFERDKAAARPHLRLRELPCQHRGAAGDGGRDAPRPPGRASGPPLAEEDAPRHRRARPVPSVPRSAGRRQELGLNPRRAGWTRPCGQAWAGEGAEPRSGPAPRVPSAGLGAAGRGVAAAVPPRPSGGSRRRDRNRCPARAAAAARLLPAAPRTASPGSAGPDRCHRPGGGGTGRGPRGPGGARSRVPPQRRAGGCSGLAASPGCRCLPLILCLPEESFLLQSNLHLIQSRQISS